LTLNLARCALGENLPVSEGHDFEEVEFLPAGNRKPFKDFKHRKQYRCCFQISGEKTFCTLWVLELKETDCGSEFSEISDS